MEMAGMRVSATAFTLSILNSQLDGEYPPNSIYSATISARKQFVPLYLNKFRVIALIDSGADMSCMHDSLLRKILPKHKMEITRSTQTDQCFR